VHCLKNATLAVVIRMLCVVAWQVELILRGYERWAETYDEDGPLPTLPVEDRPLLPPLLGFIHGHYDVSKLTVANDANGEPLLIHSVCARRAFHSVGACVSTSTPFTFLVRPM